MEDFNQNIKNKIDTYQIEEDLTDTKVASFFERLDAQSSQEKTVVPLYNAKESQFSMMKIAASIVILIASILSPPLIIALTVSFIISGVLVITSFIAINRSVTQGPL